MRIVYKRCCGMDVHKDSVTACVLRIDEDGEFEKQTRSLAGSHRTRRSSTCWPSTGKRWPKPCCNLGQLLKAFHRLTETGGGIYQLRSQITRFRKLMALSQQV